MLVSRLENLVSDRRLVEYCSLRLDMLYFLGYEVYEDLLWHSTISRTHQLFPAAVLVTGHTQAVDSAPVKANASLESLCEKRPAEAPTLHLAGEPVPQMPVAPSAALLASPAHELRRVATTHARYLRGPLRAQSSLGPAAEQQSALQSRRP